MQDQTAGGGPLPLSLYLPTSLFSSPSLQAFFRHTQQTAVLLTVKVRINWLLLVSEAVLELKPLMLRKCFLDLMATQHIILCEW